MKICRSFPLIFRLSGKFSIDLVLVWQALLSSCYPAIEQLLTSTQTD